MGSQHSVEAKPRRAISIQEAQYPLSAKASGAAAHIQPHSRILDMPPETPTLILRYCIPETFNLYSHNNDTRFSGYEHPANDPSRIARVCKTFHEISMDMLSKEATLQLSFQTAYDNRCSPSSSLSSGACIGGANRCFLVSEQPTATSSYGLSYHARHKSWRGAGIFTPHIPIKVFDLFRSVRVFVIPNEDCEAPYPIPTLKAFTAIVDPFARAERGAKLLKSLTIVFELEITMLPVEPTIALIGTTLAPFKRRCGLQKVRFDVPFWYDEASLMRFMGGWNRADSGAWYERFRMANAKLFDAVSQ
ncbi:MAG: hypothetical protein M1831_006497 [Alyxoria varia]|nr:MAG: hypothetical protein M1831_006497 [Alyxoria varia]